MTPAAFYAPMKPPDDPVPSGDRTMARALIAALNHAGFRMDLASRFRSRDPLGDPEAQQHLKARAKTEASELVRRGRAVGWRFWFTYHNYYKAPDLIGPAVAHALSIPYVLVEATRARKRLGGPWGGHAQAAEQATDAAALVFYLTARDAEALKAYACPSQHLEHLRPFLPRLNLPPASGVPPAILSVGMFRKGDKQASYHLIAETLSRLKIPDWRLTIVGDGPARTAIEAEMKPFGGQVTFAGALSGDALQSAYAQAGVFFWPGVNEAFGMTYLEAQAAGLCVVAQDRPGVRDVLAPGLTRPAPDAGAAALASEIDQLLHDHKARKVLGKAARDYIAKNHLMDTAAQTLHHALTEILS